MASIICPTCGSITKEDVVLYDVLLRRQRFGHTPMNPRCKACGHEVAIHNPASGGQVIVVNGTCGSGKSTVAWELMQHHGYYAIDSDCVVQSVKHKLGMEKVSPNAPEALAEMAYEMDVIRLYSDKIVLAQVILPEELSWYEQFFAQRHMTFHCFLLQPTCDEALARCQTRTCHPQPTPEYWVRFFYEKTDCKEQMTVIDNTQQTVAETTQAILAQVNG